MLLEQALRSFKEQRKHSKHQETLFHCKGDQALAQVAERGCGISTLGDIQKLSGHSAGQPALDDPT